MITLTWTGTYAFFYACEMKVERTPGLTGVNNSLFEGTCGQTHTLCHIWCRFQVVGIELTLTLNHRGEIVWSIFYHSWSKSIPRFCSTHPVLTGNWVSELYTWLVNLMALSSHGVYWWISILLCPRPCSVTCNRDRGELGATSNTLFDITALGWVKLTPELTVVNLKLWKPPLMIQWLLST
jgi:hypothetical protein